MSLACKQPYIFQVGPYVSTAFVTELYGRFVTAVSDELNCPLEIHRTKTHEEHVRRIFNRQGDLFISSSHYSQALIKRNFSIITVSHDLFQSYIVTRNRTATMGELEKLKGGTILTPGKFNRGHTYLLRTLDKKNLLKSTNLITSHNYTESTLKLLKNKADAAVILNFVYDKMPDNIRQNLPIIAKTNFYSAIISAHDSIKPELLNTVNKHLNKITFMKWQPRTKRNTAIKSTDESEFFEQELQELLNSQ